MGLFSVGEAGIAALSGMPVCRSRARSGAPHPTGAPVLRHGDVEIDLAARRVSRGGEDVRLTPKEYGFVAELAKSPGRVVTHTQLLRTVWGAGHENDVEYLRVAARAIRRKLEQDPSRPTLLRNEPGVGYRLQVEA